MEMPTETLESLANLSTGAFAQLAFLNREKNPSEIQRLAIAEMRRASLALSEAFEAAIKADQALRLASHYRAVAEPVLLTFADLPPR